MLRSFLLLTLALCACTATAMHRFRPADKTAIIGLLEDQRDAWNRGDLESYMLGYVESPELIFTSGAQIRKGYQETLDRYRARYGQDAASMGQLEFEILELQTLGADGAVVLGRWSLANLAEPAGGVFSVVVERRPEGWRIVHDHTSSSPAAN